MGLTLTLAAFFFVLMMSWRSLGRGIAATVAVGYFYGILRARHPDVYSHFMFDAALFALYATQFLRGQARARTERTREIKPWVIALCAWPAVSILITATLPVTQPLLVQIVGLRASTLFVPLLILGARMRQEDMEHVYKWVVVLTLFAFVVALMQLQLGVDMFFPDNEITTIIHHSTDVGVEREKRIPSLFSSAHAYAGTMVGILPILLGRERGSRWRTLGTLTLVVAVLGVFISGARSPVVQIGIMALLLLATTRVSPARIAAMLIIALLVGYFVKDNPRLQRFETLQDTEYVQLRFSWSVNKSFLQVVTEYPMGAGLGSAAGTSIPFFLLDEALPQVGLENEYSRIALEQGVIGLLLWLAFLGWALLRRPRQRGQWTLWQLRLMWVFTLVSWATAVIGTGLTTSIPFTVLLMVQMGALAADRRATAPVSAPVLASPRAAGA